MSIPLCVKLLGWAAESLELPAEKSNVEFIDSWCQHNRGNECSLSTRIGVCYVATTMLALHRAKIHSLRFLLFFSHFICINIVGRKFHKKLLRLLKSDEDFLPIEIYKKKTGPQLGWLKWQVLSIFWIFIGLTTKAINLGAHSANVWPKIWEISW